MTKTAIVVGLSIVAVIAIVLGVAFVGSNGEPSSVVLQREWTANAEFAGDVWAARAAPRYGIALQVREGSELVDPVKVVRSGTAHFGVASADRVLRENEGGANLIIVAAATFRSPVVFLARSDSGIASPEKFRGRTVGIQAGTNTELVFRALLRRSGLTDSDVKVVESGWGTTNFETGAVDVLGAFDYDEPVTLDAKSVKYITVYPEAAGVRYVGTVYFTRKDLVERDPQLVQAFVNALVEGWRNALADPAEAIRMLSEAFPAVAANAKKERSSLDRGREYFAGEDGHPLYASQGRWSDMAQDLITQGKLKSFDFARNIDYRFLEKASK